MIMRICCLAVFAMPWLMATLTGAERDVSVRDFGAVPDGKNDCLDPIQKAIDTIANAGGGIVRFPKSEQPYIVGGTIQIRSSKVALAGDGATIKLADGAANGTSNERSTGGQVHVIRVTGQPNRPIENVNIQGLTIDANIYRQRDYYNPRAIVVEYADHVRVMGVQIVHAFVGLDFGAGCRHCEARDCVVEDWTEDAFDASGDADKGSGVITTNVQFVNCHARNAPNSTGNAWEIEDGVRHIRVVDCSVSDVPRGNAFGIRNHWTAGPVDVSRDIELRRVKITNVGGKYGIYSHSAPHDRFPTNRLTDVRLVDVVCSAPVLFYGPLERVEISGGSFGAIHLGYDYGEKNRPEPGNRQPLANTHVRVRNTKAKHLNINAQAGTFTLHNMLVDARGVEHGIRIEGGAQVQMNACTVTGAVEAGIALRAKAAPELVNCIVWGNGTSFRLDNASPTVSHSCIQAGVPPTTTDGGGNFNIDPRFAGGPRGDFYLSQPQSGQKSRSSCIDAGSELAAFLALDEFTTRSDQVADTGRVDVGFHYPREPFGGKRQ